MPRTKAEPRPKRRPPDSGSVIVRSNGRIAVVLPPDLDPERRQQYGPARRQKFATREAAVAWLDTEIARRRNPSPGVTLDWTLREYLAHWWTTNEARWPSRTARNTRRMLRHALVIGDVSLRGLLALDPIRALLAYLATARWRRKKRGPDGTYVAYGPAYPYSSSTIRQVRALLHTALEALVPHVLPYNPTRPVKLARTQDKGQPVWDADQLDRFEAKALELRPDLYFPIRLMTRRALRRGEVVVVKDDDLDMVRRIVTVDETAGDVAGETGDTKGRKRRDVPLGELNEDARLHMMVRRSRTSRWLVPGQRGDKPFSLRQFNTVVKQIATAAGLDPITPKDMRATAATILLDQNVSLARVSRLLGHSSIAVTARFYDRILRPNQARMDALGENFDAAFRRASEHETEPETDSKVSGKVSDADATREGRAQ